MSVELMGKETLMTNMLTVEPRGDQTSVCFNSSRKSFNDINLTL
jgi:hypothetical protein